MTPWREEAVLLRLGRFVLERFPISSYVPLIAALVLCGRASAGLASGAGVSLSWELASVGLAVAFAFLQLRILDELRDEAQDRVGRPYRPLPRGLVSRAELYGLASASAIAGGGIAAIEGGVASAWYALALAVIWPLGLDVIHRWPIARSVVSIALVHSVIVPVILLFVWSSHTPPVLSVHLAATVLLVWGAGLTLEIARKTLEADEERAGVETYSAALGRPRALSMTAFCLVAAGLGAGLLAVAAGASGWLGLLPFILAGAFTVLATAAGSRIHTVALRTSTSMMVLAVLLWPLALSWGLR